MQVGLGDHCAAHQQCESGICAVKGGAGYNQPYPDTYVHDWYGYCVPPVGSQPIGGWCRTSGHCQGDLVCTYEVLDPILESHGGQFSRSDILRLRILRIFTHRLATHLRGLRGIPRRLLTFHARRWFQSR